MATWMEWFLAHPAQWIFGFGVTLPSLWRKHLSLEQQPYCAGSPSHRFVWKRDQTFKHEWECVDAAMLKNTVWEVLHSIVSQQKVNNILSKLWVCSLQLKDNLNNKTCYYVVFAGSMQKQIGSAKNKLLFWVGSFNESVKPIYKLWVWLFSIAKFIPSCITPLVLIWSSLIEPIKTVIKPTSDSLTDRMFMETCG